MRAIVFLLLLLLLLLALTLYYTLIAAIGPNFLGTRALALGGRVRESRVAAHDRKGRIISVRLGLHPRATASARDASSWKDKWRQRSARSHVIFAISADTIDRN